MDGQSKSIFFSATFWGLVFAALGHSGALAWLISKGIPIPADSTSFVNLALGILGDLTAAYGRVRASSPVHVIAAPAGSSSGQGGFARLEFMVAATIALLLVACAAVTPQNPQQAVYEVEGSYTAIERSATVYASLPRCDGVLKICSQQAVIEQIREARTKARVAINAAEAVARTPGAGANAQTAIVAAQQAVAVIVTLVPSIVAR